MGGWVNRRNCANNFLKKCGYKFVQCIEFIVDAVSLQCRSIYNGGPAYWQTLP